MLVTGQVDVRIDRKRDTRRIKNYGIAPTPSGHWIIGNFAGTTNDGSLSAVNLFLRTYCSSSNTKTAENYARRILTWVSFLEVLRCRGKEVPYTFDLFDAEEADLLQYKRYLRERPSPKTGQPLIYKTWGPMIRLVCQMYQFWADIGLYHKTLGPADNRLTNMERTATPHLSVHPLDADPLAHTRKNRASKTETAPMGSKHARHSDADVHAYRNRDTQVVKCFSTAEIEALQKYLHLRINDPKERRKDGVVRDELLVNLILLTGLRVSEIQKNISVAELNRMNLNGRRDAEEIKLPAFVGKYNKSRDVFFPVALVRMMQRYIREIRSKAVDEGIRRGKIRREPDEFFLSHEPAHIGKPMTRRALQAAVERMCIGAGLCEYIRNGQNLRAKATHSIHDFRHTYAVRTFYAQYKILDDRVSAMTYVSTRLGHAQISTTESIYAPYVERHKTLDEFSKQLDQDRLDHREMMGAVDDDSLIDDGDFDV